MYNETIYNVIIGPHVEDRLFRKRRNFTKWLWTGVIFSAFCIGYVAFDVFKNINFRWIGSILSLGGILYLLWTFHTVFYNPLRKYHISLQIYLYFIFMDYFYFQSNKYPSGWSRKMQYFTIVQSCIDSIDKYIRMMETLLINGNNTISKIIYLRSLRNLLYKMKNEVFFKNQIGFFREILDDFYSSIHIGLKAVLDFNDNVEYLDAKIQKCIDIPMEDEISLTNFSRQENNKISGRMRRTILILAVSAIIVLASFMIPDKKWSIIILNISVISNVITVLLAAIDTK